VLAAVGRVALAAERPEGGAVTLLSRDAGEGDDDDVEVGPGAAAAGPLEDVNPMTLATAMTKTAASAAHA
jgi:hypothetical protein